MATDKIFSKLPQWLNLEQADHMEKPMDAIVTGSIPKWITGSLYRNGSGIYRVGQTAWNHVFDGFAVIQRWTFKDGKVTFQSSILDTEDYKKSVHHDRIVGAGFASKFPDPCQTLFSSLFHKFVPAKPETVDNTAVNIVEFGDRLFALTETPLLNEVTADSLKVTGKTILPNYVAVHLGTAHPHILRDGTMIYYGTNLDYSRAYNFVSIPPQPASSETPFSGAQLVATAPSRWKLNISYTHSFGLTENYFIHLEQPLAINLPRLMTMALCGSSVADCFVTHQGESLDILVIDKSSGKRTPVTYKAPSGFVFHFVNCYEDMDHIVCDVSYYTGGADAIKTLYLDHLANNFTRSYTLEERVQFARFVLPLKLDEAEEGKNLVTLPNTTATAVLKKNGKKVVHLTPETIEGSPVAELPRINNDFDGVKYRYFYGSTAFIQDKKQLSKFDLLEKRVLTYDIGDNLTPGEPIFLPRPGATEEDDGVVLTTIVADSPEVQSFLVVLDGQTFQELGRANLPEDVKMSFTFHGNFTSKTF